MARRRQEKEKLRSALAGEDTGERRPADPAQVPAHEEGDQPTR
jgi:hypothetical protein